MSIDYHPLAYSHMRNPNVSTEILGNISQGRARDNDGLDQEKGALYAVATLDGTLVAHPSEFFFAFLKTIILFYLLQMLVQEEQILW